MIKYIICFRDKFMSIYRNIKILEKNDSYISNTIILLFVNIFFHFPIKYILKYSKINYLYKTDSLYFYENYTTITNNIYPMILTFKLLNSLNELDLYEKIKLYNLNVPIKMFFINENINIEHYDTICIKTFKTKENVRFKIKDFINYKLSDFIK